MIDDNLASGIGRRYQALDGLRGVAALFVILLHVKWSNHLTSNNFVQHGYIAVDLFFILSGLVIASNYSNRIANAKEAGSFVGLRFFRLYPLHIAMLGAFVFLEFAKLAAHRAFGIIPGVQAPFTGGNTFGAAMANLFLVNGLHVLDRPSWDFVSWSISCEFAAYLAFSIVVLTGLIRSKQFFLGGALLAVAGYIGLAFERRTLDITLDWGIIRCLAGFFFGMLIFRFQKTKILQQSTKVLGGGGIAVVAAVILTMSFASGPLIVLAIPLLVVGIMLLQSDEGPVARFLISQPLQFLGRISYSIYMVHPFLVVCLMIVLKRAFALHLAGNSIGEDSIVRMSPWVGDVLVLGLVALVVVAASVTYALIEEPGRLFGRRMLTNSRNRFVSIVSPVTMRRICEEDVDGIHQ